LLRGIYRVPWQSHTHGHQSFPCPLSSHFSYSWAVSTWLLAFCPAIYHPTVDSIHKTRLDYPDALCHAQVTSGGETAVSGKSDQTESGQPPIKMNLTLDDNTISQILLATWNSLSWKTCVQEGTSWEVLQRKIFQITKRIHSLSQELVWILLCLQQMYFKKLSNYLTYACQWFHFQHWQEIVFLQTFHQMLHQHFHTSPQASCTLLCELYAMILSLFLLLVGYSLLSDSCVVFAILRNFIFSFDTSDLQFVNIISLKTWKFGSKPAQRTRTTWTGFGPVLVQFWPHSCWSGSGSQLGRILRTSSEPVRTSSKLHFIINLYNTFKLLFEFSV